MLAIAFTYMTYIQGIIISVICLVVCYIVLQIWIYVKNGYYLPPIWSIINISILTLCIIAATLVSWIVEEYRTFLGISISVWIFAALLLVYALAELTSDISKIETIPVFFSPWIFPVYIYNAKKNDVESHSLPSVALILGLLVLIVWSVLCSVWVYPHNVGVSLSIIFEDLLVIAMFHLMGVSSN
jgi:hypothetical protein